MNRLESFLLSAACAPIALLDLLLRRLDERAARRAGRIR
jgi:hypothetical protein